jgi:hypothetical protein
MDVSLLSLSLVDQGFQADQGVFSFSFHPFTGGKIPPSFPCQSPRQTVHKLSTVYVYLIPEKIKYKLSARVLVDNPIRVFECRS